MDVRRVGVRGLEFQFARVEVTCRYATPRGVPRVVNSMCNRGCGMYVL